MKRLHSLKGATLRAFRGIVDRLRFQSHEGFPTLGACVCP
jgi:hypothetical protein